MYVNIENFTLQVSEIQLAIKSAYSWCRKSTIRKLGRHFRCCSVPETHHQKTGKAFSVPETHHQKTGKAFSGPEIHHQKTGRPFSVPETLRRKIRRVFSVSETHRGKIQRVPSELYWQGLQSFSVYNP